MAARQRRCLLRRRRRGFRSRVHREEREFPEGPPLRLLFGRAEGGAFRAAPSRARAAGSARRASVDRRRQPHARGAPQTPAAAPRAWGDRKSTRLNSSHLVISYAVFCLKKKKKMLQALILRCVSLSSN